MRPLTKSTPTYWSQLKTTQIKRPKKPRVPSLNRNSEGFSSISRRFSYPTTILYTTTGFIPELWP